MRWLRRFGRRARRAPQTELTDEIQFETQWGHSLGGIDPVHPMPERAARFMAFGPGRAYTRTIQVGSWVVVDDEGVENMTGSSDNQVCRRAAEKIGEAMRRPKVATRLSADALQACQDAATALLEYANQHSGVDRRKDRTWETQEGNTDNE